MKIILTIFMLMFFTTSDCYIESGWQGIKVFESPKDSVEKLLGEPVDSNSFSNFGYDKGEVFYRFEFSEGECTNLNTNNGRYKLKKGTVISYRIYPKKVIKITDLKWKKSLYEVTEDPHIEGYTYYTNDEAGISVLTAKNVETEKVLSIEYFPTKTLYEQFTCQENINE